MNMFLEFDAQFKSTQAMASSLDYMLAFILNDAGRWVMSCVCGFMGLMGMPQQVHTAPVPALLGNVYTISSSVATMSCFISSSFMRCLFG